MSVADETDARTRLDQGRKMTPRQRWMSLLQGDAPDRIPTDIWFTPEVHQRLLADLGCEDDESLYRKLNIDRPHHIDLPFGVPVPCKFPHHPDDPQANIWGVRVEAVRHGTGEYAECAYSPIASARSVAEVEAFRWPTPDDFDYSHLASQVAQLDGERIVQAGAYEPFNLTCQLRGMEQAYMDLLIAPDIMDAILAHVFDFFYEHNRRLFEACEGKIDLFYLAEDLGAQSGPLMSLDTYRRFFKPNQIRMADLARKHGIRIFYHTDGAAADFLPDLVDDVGIDLLNPIQYRCPGMERATLVRDFGDRVVFHGAIDNQNVLPFGSPDDVAEEVKRNAEAFAGARWICAPCHMIQSNTPTANVVAMYETVQRLNDSASCAGRFGADTARTAR